jgi:hypothetical protein
LPQKKNGPDHVIKSFFHVGCPASAFMNFPESGGGGSTAEMPQELFSAGAFLDSNLNPASAESVAVCIGNDAHADEDFMVMGGYGDAEVPDGMRSLVGNAASPHVRNLPAPLKVAICSALHHILHSGMFKATVERTAGANPTVSLRIAGVFFHVSRNSLTQGLTL